MVISSGIEIMRDNTEKREAINKRNKSGSNTIIAAMAKTIKNKTPLKKLILVYPEEIIINVIIYNTLHPTITKPNILCSISYIIDIIDEINAATIKGAKSKKIEIKNPK